MFKLVSDANSVWRDPQWRLLIIMAGLIILGAMFISVGMVVSRVELQFSEAQSGIAVGVEKAFTALETSGYLAKTPVQWNGVEWIATVAVAILIWQIAFFLLPTTLRFMVVFVREIKRLVTLLESRRR